MSARWVFANKEHWKRAAVWICLAVAMTASLAILSLLGTDRPRPSVGEDAASEIKRLQRQLDALKPKGYWVVIDTGANRLYLRRGDEVLLEAVCSTGSGRRLVSPARSWSFETPRGEFAIQNKVRNPVWRKPDWAFLEEGLPVPDDESERYEKGVLGDYAMAIGDGYFIHGTLYTRLLGTNVTHGCIRLASKDLMRLAKTVPVGTKVYVF